MNRRIHRLLLGIGFALLAAGPLAVAAQPARISYDRAGLQIDGRDTFIYSGAFHYFRVPPGEWRDRFAKMRAAGFNAVETYVPWNYHERHRPASLADTSQLDFSELVRWLDLADEFGFYVTIRPGPYICAEWDGGGFPQWLVAHHRPADWPADRQWLQTDEPGFLAWNQHWDDAVTRVVAPRQITRRPPGTPGGVIFFQIENEFNRVNWLKSDVKRRYLEALATYARAGGIDVPLVTCWTNESRAVAAGPLRGVFDFLNRYPKWEVEKQLRPNTEKQRLSQPEAPLMTMELQGGWYSEVGGLPSRELDGIAPVQTQNLTLYMLQLGYSFINYYMLVGGTNFDDWASRETTTTYDFDAAIGEGGVIGERYARVAAIGEFLRQHGERLVRSEPLVLDATVSNPAVHVAARRAADGSVYYFVRTEERTSAQQGTLEIRRGDGEPLRFTFQLEPFGARIYHVAPGATVGDWWPRAVTLAAPAPMTFAPIVLAAGETRASPEPSRWTPLRPGESLDDHGLVDRHFVQYRVQVPANADFTVTRIGDQVVNHTPADGVRAVSAGERLSPLSSSPAGMTFAAAPHARVVDLLWENRGLQHHTTVALERHWRLGLGPITAGDTPLPVEFAAEEKDLGLAWSQPDAPADSSWNKITLGRESVGAPAALLQWYRFEFELPAAAAARADVVWRLRLVASGNGFIYVNGRCLGRTWEAGPQREFHLPAEWLHFGPQSRNRITVGLRPLGDDARVLSASLHPVATVPAPFFQN